MKVIILPILFIGFLLLRTCNNGDSVDIDCCYSITQGNYTETLIIINDFLNNLNYKDSGNLGENSNLEQLEDWLEQQIFIKSKYENDCQDIKTYLAQVEIKDITPNISRLE